jgi:hypothetical protein
MLKKTLSSLAIAAAVVFGGAVAAHAGSAPSVTAEPASIAAGEETTVTATGLGGLETAYFGLGGGGSLIDPSTGQETNLVEAPASGGTATVRFTAADAGDYVVSVGDGETSLAQVTVTVTGAETPEPAPTVTVTTTTEPVPAPSPTPTATPVDSAGIPLWATILIVVLAVLVVGAIVTIIVLVARRGKSGPTRS